MTAVGLAGQLEQPDYMLQCGSNHAGGNAHESTRKQHLFASVFPPSGNVWCDDGATRRHRGMRAPGSTTSKARSPQARRKRQADIGGITEVGIIVLSPLRCPGPVTNTKTRHRKLRVGKGRGAASVDEAALNDLLALCAAIAWKLPSNVFRDCPADRQGFPRPSGRVAIFGISRDSATCQT